ncbi:hypothetical protein [Lysobacter capsici]|uniref:hypothetical protein n=1 Tax=Lysobacter capsici TaxID=435897 RepID=UPI00287B6BC9|nr:hypothetical protein [Lysobacter capsici]WND78526.1 hypothetical protein RJ610_14535 [Lysobacter capsici]WND83721.1 hypothetical protein RJ609_14545 [Lysobacter capsici]
MSVDENSNSSVIISTVERAELLAAVGREIERVDRLSASNGYTNWALWAALGVVGWKLVEVLQKGVSDDVGFVYLCLIVSMFTLRSGSRVLGDKGRRGGNIYVSFQDMGVSETFRAFFTGLLAVVCIGIQFFRPVAHDWQFWLPIFFLLLPSLALFVAIAPPKLPISDGWPKKGPGRLGLWFIYMWILVGVSSCIILALQTNWLAFHKPTSSVQAGVLLFVMTVLAFRLARNIQAEERRDVLQRLETELTLSKIDVSDARERYENLMLGMNVSVAIRPWIDRVMIPLDEANAGLSEVKQLLNKMNEALSADSDNAVLEVAVKQRASSLLKNVERSITASSKAHARLKGMCLAMFGEKDLSASPIAQEAERIMDAQNKIEEAVAEVKKLFNNGDAIR